ncbi:hypothetical protein CYMTET_25211 [Cymbomonas tetramitiformis]|uniref:Uncharacterized protein n=1 Tax=Cymbomonas tetramitiformis TaxID=36881 RepID=A0AAE0KZ98_9CHLO|nr:hypothetical protein CYMTET_25211 [Cymbomonas tetramitiformis]
MTADRDQFQAEIKRHKQRVRNLKRNIPEDAAAQSRKPKRFKAEAPGSHKARVQRLNRKGEHLERVLKGMESAAVVKESIDEYQSLPGEAKRENAELPAIAEYFLGHLRTMPYGPSVAAEQRRATTVDMPKVKPLHVIKAKREEIAASIGLSENDDGSLAEVDLHSKIAAVIKQMRDSQTGMLHTRTARTTDELECFLSARKKCPWASHNSDSGCGTCKASAR